MSEKVEGTIVLDGLIEGKLPDTPGAEQLLREWIEFAAGASLKFSLELEGASFNILAANTPIAAGPLGPKPAVQIAGTLAELLKVFPPGQGHGAFSTLRSVEYRRGMAVQTLYTIAADGTVNTQERTVDAQTTAPPEPVSRREILRMAVFGVGVAAIVLAVSSIFVDYGDLWARIVEGATPFRAEELKVDAAAFKDYFTVESKAKARGGKAVVLTLKRTKDFPLDAAAIDKLPAAKGDSLTARLALEAIARGYVRCERFGKDDEFLGFTMQRISGLRQTETIQLAIPLPIKKRLTRLAITY